jgi:hypothetical protein
VDIDANVLLASLAVGSIGFVCFAYGKKQGRVPQMLAGVTLFVYPYFVTNALVTVGIAVVVLVALWLAVRLGW